MFEPLCVCSQAGVVENIQDDMAKASTESVFYSPLNQIPESLAPESRYGSVYTKY